MPGISLDKFLGELLQRFCWRNLFPYFSGKFPEIILGRNEQSLWKNYSIFVSCLNFLVKNDTKSQCVTFFMEALIGVIKIFVSTKKFLTKNNCPKLLNHQVISINCYIDLNFENGRKRPNVLIKDNQHAPHRMLLSTSSEFVSRNFSALQRYYLWQFLQGLL